MKQPEFRNKFWQRIAALSPGESHKQRVMTPSQISSWRSYVSQKLNPYRMEKIRIEYNRSTHIATFTCMPIDFGMIISPEAAKAAAKVVNGGFLSTEEYVKLKFELHQFMARVDENRLNAPDEALQVASQADDDDIEEFTMPELPDDTDFQTEPIDFM